MWEWIKKVGRYIWSFLRTTVVFLGLEISTLMVMWIIYLVKKLSPTLPASKFEFINICKDEVELWIFVLFNITGAIILLVYLVVDIISTLIKARVEIENSNSMYGGDPKVLPKGYDVATKEVVNSMENVGEIKKRERKGGGDNESDD